jgi:hypothetical protein
MNSRLGPLLSARASIEGGIPHPRRVVPPKRIFSPTNPQPPQDMQSLCSGTVSVRAPRDTPRGGHHPVSLPSLSSHVATLLLCLQTLARWRRVRCWRSWEDCRVPPVDELLELCIPRSSWLSLSYPFLDSVRSRSGDHNSYEFPSFEVQGKLHSMCFVLHLIFACLSIHLFFLVLKIQIILPTFRIKI